MEDGDEGLAQWMKPCASVRAGDWLPDTDIKAGCMGTKYL